MADRTTSLNPALPPTERTRKRTLREERVRARRELEEKEIAAAAADANERAPEDFAENPESEESPDIAEKQKRSPKRVEHRQPDFQPFPDELAPEAEAEKRPDESQVQTTGDNAADRARQLRQAQQLSRVSGQAVQTGQSLRQAAQSASRTARAAAILAQRVQATVTVLAATWEIWLPVVIILLILSLFVVGMVVIAAAACEGQTGTLLDALPDGIRNAFVQMVTQLQCPK